MLNRMKFRQTKTHRTIAGILCLMFSLILLGTNAAAQSLSQSDQDSIYDNTVWYKPSIGAISQTSFCLGGPGGSGPLYGPAFPQVPDTAALSAAIANYISKAVPSSPLAAYSDTFVGLGLKDNVNPVMVVAMAQKETSLGTAGYGTPSGGYNITNVRPNGTFAQYGSYTQGIDATYQNLLSGLYLGPPASDTTISQVITRWAPPSDNNDTSGYIQFVGSIMKIILGSLSNLPSDVTSDTCSSGGQLSGAVDSGTDAQLAQKLLNYQSTGQYHCDNSGDCVDLQKMVKGQSLAGSSGCMVQSLDPRVLQMLLYLIEVGNFKIGTFAMFGDHGFDSLSGHSGGLAVDISTVNGASLGVPVPQAGVEGTKLDQFLNNLPVAIQLDQQISYGYGGQYYKPMADLQQFNGSLCTSACVSDYGASIEQQHTNHIHAGFK